MLSHRKSSRQPFQQSVLLLMCVFSETKTYVQSWLVSNLLDFSTQQSIEVESRLVRSFVNFFLLGSLFIDCFLCYSCKKSFMYTSCVQTWRAEKIAKACRRSLSTEACSWRVHHTDIIAEASWLIVHCTTWQGSGNAFGSFVHGFGKVLPCWNVVLGHWRWSQQLFLSLSLA